MTTGRQHLLEAVAQAIGEACIDRTTPERDICDQIDAARAAFDRAAPKHGVHACVELQFMAEVLAPVPDLLLRSQYRAAVLRQAG